MKIRLVEDMEESVNDVVLYNGSPVDYDKVDPAKLNIHDDGYLGKGFYLTKDEWYATSYGPYLKQFRVNLDIVFNFNDIEDSTKYELAKYIVDNNYDRLSEKITFPYYMERKSDDDTLKYAANQIKRGRFGKDDFEYIISYILDNPEHVFYGALHDFSDDVTAFMMARGYQGAFVSHRGVKYYELIIYDVDNLDRYIEFVEQKGDEDDADSVL